MKRLILAALLLVTASANAQIVGTGPSNINLRSEWYLLSSPTNNDGNRTVIGWISGNKEFRMGMDTIKFTSLTGSGTRMVVATPTGRLTTQTIPSMSQVNADWNSSSGASEILNKPTIPTNTNQLTNGSGFITGITSGMVTTALGYTPSSFNPTGTTSQYVRGDGSLATFPTVPAQVNVTGGQNTKVTGTYPNITVADSTTTRYYNASGRINQNMKVYTATVTPSTSNGYSIDISAAGFTTVTSVQVIAIRNTASAASSPNVSIKSKSNTAVVVNVVEDNPATVTILGINVLSGSPSVFANVTGLTLDVTVIGY